MTKTELVAVVAEKAGLKVKDSKAAVDAVITAIYDALAEGEKVSLAGFGVFEVKTRAARKGVNPATKQPIDIPEAKTVAFKATSSLKDKIN